MWWSSRNVRSVHLRPVEDTKAHWPASRRQTARWTSRGIWRESRPRGRCALFLPPWAELSGIVFGGGGGTFSGVVARPRHLFFRSSRVASRAGARVRDPAADAVL